LWLNEFGEGEEVRSTSNTRWVKKVGVWVLVCDLVVEDGKGEGGQVWGALVDSGAFWKGKGASKAETEL
jgi:hypothetical protein